MPFLPGNNATVAALLGWSRRPAQLGTFYGATIDAVAGRGVLIVNWYEQSVFGTTEKVIGPS